MTRHWIHGIDFAFKPGISLRTVCGRLKYYQSSAGRPTVERKKSLRTAATIQEVTCKSCRRILYDRK